ncbi:MAG: translocation/assembly module TamB domain-containing protein, partial [Amaricoccus sp.]
GLAGTVNGTARVTGPRATPDVRFDVAGAGIESAITRGAGLPPVAVKATGQTADNRLNLDASVSSQNGLSASAKGSVPLGAGDMDVAINLQAFPLALVDRVAGNRGLRGTVTGTGHATGPLADPTVAFNLRGDGIDATVLDTNGFPPLNLTAAGQYRGQALRLDSARVTGAGGLDLTGSGTVPFAGPGLDASVTGTAPLSIVNPLLAERTAEATAGQLRINFTARGSLAAPDLNGRVSLTGGALVDPQTNLRLQAMAFEAALSGNAVVLESFRTDVATGGNITAQGRVGLGRGFPADLTMRMNNVRYTDGNFVSTQVSGNLALNGPLVGGGGKLSGTIDLGRTEISIAEGLGASSQVVDQIDHYRPPAAVQQTLDRARVGTEARQSSGPSGPGIGLDVRIRAPAQIFVRGRGLDVELGGELRIQGTTSDIQPVGQFDLRRGRLIILGQRIEFDQGNLQLVGNLDPQLYFVAQTRSGDVTAFVTVQGRASAPQITFSSEPALPQDEVLARVLFNRATQNLSAFQMAQLAAAAAELAGGGGGPGFLGEIRGATGLDDLDIITQEDGSTAVRAGKYVSKNVYVDVQSDTRGISTAEINLTVNDNLTARGSVASDGNTTIGLFFERDF